MFGLVNRTRFERVSNDSGVSSRKTCSPPPEEEDEEEMDEETYERRARLCHSKLVAECIICKLYVTCYDLLNYIPLWYAT